MEDITILLKQHINDEDNRKLEELRDICIAEENMFLKLELDFKLRVREANGHEPFRHVNEFLYYEGETLVGYIGIGNYGGPDGELTGMVHPQYRRRGIFTRLYNLAVEECKRRSFEKILLVCDNSSSSGLEFIKSTGAVYSFSEYEMKTEGQFSGEAPKNIALRKALNSDADEIGKQNIIYFGGGGRLVIMPEEEEKRNRITYMIELDSKIIGKIRVEFSDKEGFISGFGILPEYRGKGYGKEALKAALHKISERNISEAALEVAAHNKNALGLYKSCGFAEQSVMNYYEAK